MKFSTSSALLLSFLLLASMMVEPVQSTEIRIRENKDKAHLNSKNKQYDFPVRRTLKGKGKGGNGGNAGSGKGGSGKGGTCSNSNAESCVSDPGLPDTACKDNVNSHIDDTGACVGLELIGAGEYVNVCERMEDVTVDTYSCVDTVACYGAAFTEICESSCQGHKTCYNANSLGDPDHMLTIGPGSCRSGSFACWNLQHVEKIGSGSCLFTQACYFMNAPSTGNRTTVGDNSCIGEYSCYRYQGTSIGDNACVGNNICRDCMVDVPKDKCNVENGVTTCANCPCACPP